MRGCGAAERCANQEQERLHAGLTLELKDFAPKDLAEGILDSFLIDPTILCRFPNEAEQETKKERGVVQHLLPGAKKRRREETPASADTGVTGVCGTSS